MKRLPIGISDLEEMLKKNYYYVDKTMLIKDVVELPGKVKLITRPRRFGKTLNLNTLERFFSMKESEGLFEGLKIWNERGIVEEYHHKYPVVFVSFKEVKEVNWKNAFDKMKRILANLMLEYENEMKGDFERDYFVKIVEKNATEADYSDVLRFLSRVLHRNTGKKVIVLIDEYDVPLESAYIYRSRDPDYYENMAAFMRGFLTAALKDNEHLEFAVLTGVYRVAKESIFSGLNNLAIYSVLENEMAERFGFTEEEVGEMLKHYGLGNEDERIIKDWYGGYRFGDRFLYNPWSVIYYIKERVEGGKSPDRAARQHWINTSSNDLIKEQVESNPDLRDELDVLLSGGEVERVIEEDLSLRDLEENPSGVWVLLVNGGYLSARYLESGEIYALRIPNEEIMRFFKRSVLSWLEKVGNVKTSKLLEGLRAVVKRGDYEKFKRVLKNFVVNALSYFDVGGGETERVYKALLVGMMSIATNGYVVESELESGYGRLDLVVYPRDRIYGRYALIFEIKRASDGSRLKELSRKALEQIKTRGYYTKMVERGYGVVGFGMAFFGKRLEIEARVFQG